MQARQEIAKVQDENSLQEQKYRDLKEVTDKEKEEFVRRIEVNEQTAVKLQSGVYLHLYIHPYLHTCITSTCTYAYARVH